MDQANILIIGGGVIGCAIAGAVSASWQDVFLVEQFPKLEGRQMVMMIAPGRKKPGAKPAAEAGTTPSAAA